MRQIDSTRPEFPQYKVKRLTPEQLALPNPRIFELIHGKFKSEGSSRLDGVMQMMIKYKNKLLWQQDKT